MTNTAKEVWVFIEHRNGKPADVSLELLSKGRKLADAMKAIVIGHDLDPVVHETFRFGTDEVLRVEHPDLADYRTQPYSRVICELIEERQPNVVLYGATYVGRDLAPRVASSSRSGLTADCTELVISAVSYRKKDYPELLLQIRPAFGGNIVATIITPDVHVQMATVREGVMELTPLDTPRQGTVTDIPYAPTPADELVKILERHQEETRSSLKDASVVVAGGYGMGSKERFGLIHRLAEVLGGEVAGTRPAADAGFIPHDRQIGQTGLTIRPKLYVACAISGAIQHVAGMQDSNRIIAVNNDPEAPIFDVCHYGIVGDVAQVIPMVIETYKDKLR